MVNEPPPFEEGSEEDERGERRRRTLSIVLAVLIIASTSAAAYFGQRASSSSHGAAEAVRALRDSNEITACRSLYRADYDDAQSVINDAQATITDLFQTGLLAQVQNEPQDIAAIIKATNDTRAVRDAALVLRDAALTAYKGALDRSVKDPSGFITSCRQRR